ncbi:hypothetical protein HY338_01710 [Candidatus Gottesmanbacteria bacterium]|nr:hypothetical protein [Candidatus Gottesmanbacteria bacterium]
MRLKLLFITFCLITAGIYYFKVHQVLGESSYSHKFVWVSSPGRQFTEEELMQLANNYQIVVIGNAHGNYDRESYNQVVRSLVSLNPDIKVFPYYNTTRRFDIINSGTGFNDNWYLKDLTGNLVYDDGDAGHNNPYYDLSNANYRAWAVNFIADWVNQAPFAGMALDDANPQELQSWEDQIGQAKANVWNDGRVQFVRQVKEALGSKLVIYNGITADYSEFLDNDSADGALNEMFCYQRNSQIIFNKAKLLNQIEFMREYGRKDKIILEKTNLNPNPQKSANPTPNSVEKRHIARLCLGSFLLGYAPSKTYYKAGPGYRSDLGEIETNALESGLNFGKPIGDYQIEGKSLKRKYDNGWIFINFESTPENVRVPEQLIYANGGVEGHVYSAGDELVLKPRDGAFLLKSAAFIAPTTAPTSTPTSTPTLPVPTATGVAGPSITSGPSPTSPAGGGIFNYDVGASLFNLASDPFNILGAIVILFFLIY